MHYDLRTYFWYLGCHATIPTQTYSMGSRNVDISLDQMCLNTLLKTYLHVIRLSEASCDHTMVDSFAM